MEVFVPIPGYEDYYLISNLGRILSLRTGKIRKTTYNKNNGYLMVVLNGKDFKKTCTVHRLVAKAFIPNPDDLECVNHKNEVKTDNRVENLEWCTKYYNNTYNGKMEKCFKPIEQYTMDGIYVKTWVNARVIDSEGIANYKNISAVCRGKRKSAGGYKWKFKERS